MDRASAALAHAVEIQTATLQRRNEWKRWWAIWHGTPQLIRVCCYCGQVEWAGQWVTIPPWVVQRLHRARGFRGTHGYCPACVEAHAEDFM